MRDVALGVACDGLNGEIASEQDLYDSLASQFQGLTQSELEAAVDSTIALWEDLYQASTIGSDEERAVAALTCYLLEAVA